MLPVMNKNKRARFSGALVVLAAASHANAQQAPRCSDLYDDAQRLACYDAAFGKPARPGTAPAAPPAAPAASSSSVNRSAPATAPTAPAVVPVPPAQAAASAAPAAAALPKNISASIKEVARRPDGRFVVTLDNGLVWSQLERDTVAEVTVGDAVTIRGGALGSYILTTRGGVRTRVKAGR